MIFSYIILLGLEIKMIINLEIKMPLGTVSKASEMLRVETRPNGWFAIETNRKPTLDIFASGLSCLTVRNREFFGRVEVEK